jgi:hypothetical protein
LRSPRANNPLELALAERLIPETVFYEALCESLHGNNNSRNFRISQVSGIYFRSAAGAALLDERSGVLRWLHFSTNATIMRLFNEVVQVYARPVSSNACDSLKR